MIRSSLCSLILGLPLLSINIVISTQVLVAYLKFFADRDADVFLSVTDSQVNAASHCFIADTFVAHYLHEVHFSFFFHYNRYDSFHKFADT